MTRRAPRAPWSPARRLVAFGAVLAAAFGSAYAVGAALPDLAPSPSSPPATSPAPGPSTTHPAGGHEGMQP